MFPSTQSRISNVFRFPTPRAILPFFDVYIEKRFIPMTFL